MKAAKIRAVLFDMDGTMFDTERLWVEVFRNTLQKMGLPGPAALYQNVLGMTGEPVFRYLVDAFHVDTAAKQEQFSQLCEIYHKKIFVRGRIKLKKGLLELLDFLQTRDIPWAVVTSSELWEVQRFFDFCDLNYIPNIVVTADSVAHSKPAPDPFLAAAEQLDVPPAECLVLEDSRLGIQSAFAAGMQTIMIPDLIMPTQTERKRAMILPDMTQVVRFLEKSVNCSAAGNTRYPFLFAGIAKPRHQFCICRSYESRQTMRIFMRRRRTKSKKFLRLQNALLMRRRNI